MHMTKKTLTADGFAGFRAFEDLEIMRVPQGPGIFAVLKPAAFEPRFLAKSAAGTFRKKDPSLKKEALAAEWVAEADVLYLGKASAGSQGNRGLRKQVQEFVDYGRGRPIIHWDGRLLWQLADSEDLIIAWKELPAAEVNVAEASYHAEFRRLYGSLPFANLVQSRGSA